jgi:tripartite-type tricarboxylate transporter receptor subunit TctC
MLAMAPRHAMQSAVLAAENFPSRPCAGSCRPPGGGTDQWGHRRGQAVGALGQLVSIDNRGGAQGGMATAIGAKAPHGLHHHYSRTGPIAVNPDT